MSMIKIENRETVMQLTAEKKASFYDLLRIIFDGPVAEGLTWSEMSNTLSLIEKFNGEESEFTKEEVEKIKTKVDGHKWGAIHPAIVEFGKYIQSL